MIASSTTAPLRSILERYVAIYWLSLSKWKINSTKYEWCMEMDYGHKYGMNSRIGMVNIKNGYPID